MGGPRHSTVVVLYGGEIKPTPEGIGFTHFANRLGFGKNRMLEFFVTSFLHLL
jgi:hypothetical protein